MNAPGSVYWQQHQQAMNLAQTHHMSEQQYAQQKYEYLLKSQAMAYPPQMNKEILEYRKVYWRGWTSNIMTLRRNNWDVDNDMCNDPCSGYIRIRTKLFDRRTGLCGGAMADISDEMFHNPNYGHYLMEHPIELDLGVGTGEPKKEITPEFFLEQYEVPDLLDMVLKKQSGKQAEIRKRILNESGEVNEEAVKHRLIVV